jgi:adenosylcobinamide kinase / adenosylcobinamide-phosphate guanylyltransferase
VRRLGAPDTLLLVDCLTLWLTRWLMPMEGSAAGSEGWSLALEHLVSALQSTPSPVVLVSNEIGMGLAPLSREARRYVDELGRLHQQVAAVCPNATLMVAGLEMPLKRVAAGGGW